MTNEATQPLPTFRSMFAPSNPEPRRRYPKNTASTAVTTPMRTL